MPRSTNGRCGSRRSCGRRERDRLAGSADAAAAALRPSGPALHVLSHGSRVSRGCGRRGLPSKACRSRHRRRWAAVALRAPAVLRGECTYCGCNVVISRDHAIVSRYLAGLEKDVDLAARALPRSMDVAQFHLGGGTPRTSRRTSSRGSIGWWPTASQFLPGAGAGDRGRPARDDARARDDSRPPGWRRMCWACRTSTPWCRRPSNRVQSPEETASLSDARGRRAHVVNVDLITASPSRRWTGSAARSTSCSATSRRTVSRPSFAYAPGWSHQKRIDEPPCRRCDAAGPLPGGRRGVRVRRL